MQTKRDPVLRDGLRTVVAPFLGFVPASLALLLVGMAAGCAGLESLRGPAGAVVTCFAAVVFQQAWHHATVAIAAPVHHRQVCTFLAGFAFFMAALGLIGGVGVMDAATLGAAVGWFAAGRMSWQARGGDLSPAGAA